MQINFLNYLSCAAVDRGAVRALGTGSKVLTFHIPLLSGPFSFKSHSQTMRQWKSQEMLGLRSI